MYIVHSNYVVCGHLRVRVPHTKMAHTMHIIGTNLVYSINSFFLLLSNYKVSKFFRSVFYHTIALTISIKQIDFFFGTYDTSVMCFVNPNVE